ncbi:MAG TPA: PEP-CTERM sorting domain-containing protein [Tepidisphaeraceae bacterium]|nr:PEP-CTERM sorting domain-containing protein [Tepidisphaeraceae bacterium]
MNDTLRHHNYRSLLFCCALIAVAGAPAAVNAAPALTMTVAGSGATSATITQGTASITLGLSVNTDGLPIGSLLYHIETAPAAAATYASTSPIIAPGTPFTAADLFLGLAPTPGALVQAGIAGSTQWVKSSVGDYAAFNGEIAWYTFDTSAMTSDTYVFTPVGLEFANDASASDPTELFAVPGSFTLTVTAVPEPATAATVVLTLGAMAMTRSRRRRATGVS